MPNKKLRVFFLLLHTLLTSCETVNEVLPYAKGVRTFASKNRFDLFTAPSPVTTSFEQDANTEIAFMDDIDPSDEFLVDASVLEHDKEGTYILKPGMYKMETKSFCLKPGTYGPSTGDGYLYAPLKGPMANIIEKIVSKSCNDPSVSQSEVQQVIWAIIAKMKFSEMPFRYQAVVSKYLNLVEIQQLDGGAWALVPEDAKQNILKSASPSLKKVLSTEENLRESISSNQSFSALESMAVLTGPILWGDTIRNTPPGRWSYHPDGYFIRFKPSRYSRTQIQIIVPPKIEIFVGEFGQISEILIDSNMLVSFTSKGSGVKMTDEISEVRYSVVDRLKSIPNDVSISINNEQESDEITNLLKTKFRVKFSDTVSRIFSYLNRVNTVQKKLKSKESEKMYMLNKYIQVTLMYHVLRQSYKPKTDLRGIKEKIFALNYFQLPKSGKYIYSSASIKTKITAIIASPAITSKQRLLMCPIADINDDHKTYSVTFYAYSSLTFCRKSWFPSPFGHAFVSVEKTGSTPIVRGAYYGDSSFTHAQIKDDFLSIPCATISLRVIISPEEYNKVLQVNAIHYWGVWHNCVDYVDDIAEVVGLKTPYAPINTPYDYVEDLIELNTN